MTDSRFPRRVYREGAEPDPRFSLANERTFLAWLRTSLALFAAAVALEALDIPSASGFRLAAAGVFVVVGLVAAVRAWTGWMAVERAMRRQEPLPDVRVGLLVALGVVVAVILVLLGVFL